MDKVSLRLRLSLQRQRAVQNLKMYVNVTQSFLPLLVYPKGLDDIEGLNCVYVTRSINKYRQVLLHLWQYDVCVFERINLEGWLKGILFKRLTLDDVRVCVSSLSFRRRQSR